MKKRNRIDISSTSASLLTSLEQKYTMLSRQEIMELALRYLDFRYGLVADSRKWRDEMAIEASLEDAYFSCELPYRFLGIDSWSITSLLSSNPLNIVGK